MRALAAFALALGVLAAAVARDPAAPPEHRRGEEQTFLTYPEWFLVHSPAEYARFVKTNSPSDFPWFGHIGQFWSSYGAVYRETRDAYPFNFGYHVMILVIGVSTTVEYVLRSAYETIPGRLSGLAQPEGMTPEDRYAAKVAQEYVDFIRVVPWYEFDFMGKLAGLWRETPMWGPGMLRKWERRYALTTEYLIKAGYGWLIRKATKASYEEPLPVTAVLLDRLPPGAASALPELKLLRTFPDGEVLVTVPRYEAFKRYAAGLARQGVAFREIAGNRGAILVTFLASGPVPALPDGTRVMFTQPILTRPGTARLALVMPVAALARVLEALDRPGIELEHVYDY